MLAQLTAPAKTQNPYEYPLTLNPNGSINWEVTLSNQTLGDWGLYDSKAAPKLYNPVLGLLVHLPQRLTIHTGFTAIDNEDDEVAGSRELKTLLEGFTVNDCQGEPLEF